MSKSEDFSERVRKYREREGISQEELAQRLGMSRNYVSMIEGGREPSEQVVRHFELLELAPPATAAKEEPANQTNDKSARTARLIEKILRLEREGTPAQIELLDAAIESQLKVARRHRDPCERPNPSEEAPQ